MTRLHHVQVSCAAGTEDASRRFYADLLGLSEVPKPSVLAARGGVWFRGNGYELHIGVEEPFHPANKAHPAFEVDDIDAIALVLQGAGASVRWDDDFPGYRRFYTADPNGNRVEVLSPLS